jgi:predicted phosphoribosyltransferase
VVAVPVAAGDACRHLEHFADEVISARTPRNMMAVGMWYLDFAPTSDEEVQALLQSTARAGTAG